jgi:hypothetical protein
MDTTGLFSGAKAGIGVGAAAFAILLGRGAVLLWRRAQKRRAVPESETQGHALALGKPELAGQPRELPPHEPHGSQKPEALK